MVFADVWQIFDGRLWIFLLVSFTFLWKRRPHDVPHLTAAQLSPQAAQYIVNNLYLYTAAECCFLTQKELKKNKTWQYKVILKVIVSHCCVLSLHCAENLGANVWWMMICLPLKVINQTVPAKWILITSISLMRCNVCRCWVGLIIKTELQMN